MASLISRPNGHFWIQFSRAGLGKRHTLRLGKCTRAWAEVIRDHLSRLVAELDTQGHPAANSVKWLDELAKPIRDKLSRFGLCDPKAHGTLGELYTSFESSIKATAEKHNTTCIACWPIYVASLTIIAR